MDNSKWGEEKSFKNLEFWLGQRSASRIGWEPRPKFLAETHYKDEFSTAVEYYDTPGNDHTQSRDSPIQKSRVVSDTDMDTMTKARKCQ